MDDEGSLLPYSSTFACATIHSVYGNPNAVLHIKLSGQVVHYYKLSTVFFITTKIYNHK